MEWAGSMEESKSRKHLAEKILHFMETTRGYTAPEMLAIIKSELEEVRRESE